LHRLTDVGDGYDLGMTNSFDSASPRNTEGPASEPVNEQMSSDGLLDKIKNKVGHAIGSEGKRHGARDTDPGS
jgi:hypothetical protein